MTADQIKTLRARMELGQAKFGARFPVDSRTVRRWEAGDVDPSPMALQTLQRLLEALEESPETSATRRRTLTDVVK